MKKRFATGLLCLAAMAGIETQAATTYAYVHASVPASSDVLVSAPVNNSIEVQLTTSSRAGSVLTVPNVPEFAAGDFNAGSFPKYYVRFITGPAAGLWASVTVNSETTLTLDDPSVAGLASIVGGDTIRVYKHHTVGSVFPAALLGQSFVDGSQLLFYSTADAQNKLPGSGGIVNYTSFFNIGWGNNAERPLKPEEAFVIRNSSASALTYVATGFAPDHAVAYFVKSGVSKDTPLGTGYPVDVTVANTGLGTVNGRRILLQSLVQNAPAGNAGNFLYSGSWGANANVALAPNAGFIFRQSVGDAGGKATVVKPY